MTSVIITSSVWGDAAIERDVHIFQNAIKIAQKTVIVLHHQSAAVRGNVLMKLYVRVIKLKKIIVKVMMNVLLIFATNSNVLKN
jgi:hypothetical protein